MVSKLELLARTGDDYPALRINWILVCPSGGDTVESFMSLNTVESHFRGTACSLDPEAMLDDHIQVSFTVSL